MHGQYGRTAEALFGVRVSAVYFMWPCDRCAGGRCHGHEYVEVPIPLSEHEAIWIVVPSEETFWEWIEHQPRTRTEWRDMIPRRETSEAP